MNVHLDTKLKVDSRLFSNMFDRQRLTEYLTGPIYRKVVRSCLIQVGAKKSLSLSKVRGYLCG